MFIKKGRTNWVFITVFLAITTAVVCLLVFYIINEAQETDSLAWSGILRKGHKSEVPQIVPPAGLKENTIKNESGGESDAATASSTEIPGQRNNDLPIIEIKDQAFIYDSASGDLTPLTPEGFKLIKYDHNYPSADNLFLLKNNKIFVFDAIRRQVREASIPVMKNDGDSSESVAGITMSPDGSKAMITIVDYPNLPKGETMLGEKGASYKEIIYDIRADKWENLNVRGKAEEIVKDKTIGFSRWDSNNNRLFGYRSAFDVANRGTVYIVDLGAGTFSKTPDYGIEGATPFFSPSLNKIILKHKNFLLLFDSRNLAVPQKTIDMAKINDNIYSFAWSPDESQVALGFDKSIYTVDLDSGNISLRFLDNTIGSTYTFWDRNEIGYSPTGKQIYFIDYENAGAWEAQQKSLIRRENDRFKLTGVDLETNKRTVLFETTDFCEFVAGGY